MGKHRLKTNQVIHPRSPTIYQAWCMSAKSLSHVQLIATPWTTPLPGFPVYGISQATGLE